MAFAADFTAPDADPRELAPPTKDPVFLNRDIVSLCQGCAPGGDGTPGGDGALPATAAVAAPDQLQSAQANALTRGQRRAARMQKQLAEAAGVHHRRRRACAGHADTDGRTRRRMAAAGLAWNGEHWCPRNGASTRARDSARVAAACAHFHARKATLLAECAEHNCQNVAEQ